MRTERERKEQENNRTTEEIQEPSHTKAILLVALSSNGPFPSNSDHLRHFMEPSITFFPNIATKGRRQAIT